MGKSTQSGPDDKGRSRSDRIDQPPKLWKHQVASKKFFAAHDDGNDFSDPGTGKSRVQVEDFRDNGKGRALIVCPKTLMQAAWGNDIDAFAPELTYALARAGQREEAFKLGTDVVIVNSDGIKDVKHTWLSGFTRIIVDESTTYKTGSTARTKAALNMRRKFTHHRNLTGTPNPISVMEMFWPQMILDGGARLGGSYYKLRSHLCQPEQNGPLPEHIKWLDKPGAEQIMMGLIGDCTIRHEFDRVMTHVPPNHRNKKHFALSRKAQAIYERLAEDAVVMIKERAVTGVNAAVLRAKLLQVASGAVYSAPDKYELVDTTRYELISEIIEPVDHSLVFFNWKHQRDELIKQFAKSGYRFAVMDGGTSDTHRDRIVKDYQAGLYKTLLMHPKTGAHGLTLTRGTMTVISSPIYEADFLKQTIHRIYRGSQDKVTNTVLVQADNTVEELVYTRLFDKTARMEDLLMLAAERKV